MASIIFHIDVNSAFLSWTAVEQLKNGAEVDIRQVPAIIGGDQKSRHGVVLAKSLSAKKYGIHTGEPVANAFRKCPNLIMEPPGVVLAKSLSAKKYGIHTGEPVANAFRKCPNLIMEPPNHRMYRAKSAELMEYLRTYTTEIEQVSVDECYMDFTELAGRYFSPVEGALAIKNGIREKFGFTVNVGISSNKLLAKMASDFEKPDKIHTLFPEEISVKMWPLPIGDLFMAGRSSVETLKKLEIYTTHWRLIYGGAFQCGDIEKAGNLYNR